MSKLPLRASVLGLRRKAPGGFIPAVFAAAAFEFMNSEGKCGVGGGSSDSGKVLPVGVRGCAPDSLADSRLRLLSFLSRVPLRLRNHPTPLLPSFSLSLLSLSLFSPRGVAGASGLGGNGGGKSVSPFVYPTGDWGIYLRLGVRRLKKGFVLTVGVGSAVTTLGTDGVDGGMTTLGCGRAAGGSNSSVDGTGGNPLTIGGGLSVNVGICECPLRMDTAGGLCVATSGDGGRTDLDGNPIDSRSMSTAW